MRTLPPAASSAARIFLDSVTATDSSASPWKIQTGVFPIARAASA
jgi:hypothetical protein